MKFTNMLLLALLAGLYSCQRLQCPAFNDTERQQWAPYETGNTISFEEAISHNTVTLTIDEATISKAYEERSTGFAKPKDCKGSASLKISSSDNNVISIAGYELTSTFIGDSEQERQLAYQLGDLWSGFKTYPLVDMYHKDSTSKMSRDSIIWH